MEAQRRNHQRFQLDLELTLQSETNFWGATMENISDGGVFVASKELKPIGTEIEVTIKLPGDLMPIWAVGVVCWIGETTKKNDAPLGMGIQFRLISDEALRKIRDFVRQRGSATISVS